MRAVIQKVTSASVTVDKKLVSSIGNGLMVLIGVCVDDTETDVDFIVNKVLKLRLFQAEAAGAEAEAPHWKRNVAEVKGEVLCVSQFTLLAKTSKGTKPDFHYAAKGDHARSLYDLAVERIGSGLGRDRVQTGVFGAMMQVALVNDGPVTIEISSKKSEQI
ncbi:D-Tyr tRNAtyr deacylase-like domain-containing protein [Dipodascopsis tothii]|uniref:D-Tyr tRNAtyr deacylase-like domain-containing protein n=1 Tax=Dipodascopsis tothii TaxID=44089 RepID=UPI0034CD4B72